MTDVFGDAANFAKVRALYIRNKSTTTGEKLTIGGASSNAFPLFPQTTYTYEIDPGGEFKDSSPVDGKTVTAGTADKLKIDPGAATITFDIVIAGTSS